MMSFPKLISLHCKEGSDPLHKFLEKYCGKNCWLNPWDSTQAVALISTSSDVSVWNHDLQKFNINKSSEEETSSIIVIVKHECFGLVDKLKYLFEWKKNGGSKVRRVQLVENPDKFEVEFYAGWDAVLTVYEKPWKLHEESLRVIPYFKSFKKQSQNDNVYSSEGHNSLTKDGSKMGETQNSSLPLTEQSPSDRNKPSKRAKEPSKMQQEYLERFTKYKQLPESEKWNLLWACKQYTSKMSYPCVFEYLSRTRNGQQMRESIAKTYQCVIGEGSEPKTFGTNFRATILVTASIKQLKIHLVQGSAKDIKTDASLHIEDCKTEKKPARTGSNKSTFYILDPENYDGLLEKELASFLSLDVSTLAISLSLKLAEKLALDDFAKNILQCLEKLFREKSNMHILLCETKNRALFQAYQYFISKLDSYVPIDLDLKIWEEISFKDFPQEHNLSKKVQVVQSIRPNPLKECVVYLPISQNLQRFSCPYNASGLHSLENSLKYLNMSEEEQDKFYVSSTYPLSRVAHQRMMVYLYCTQDWTFDVAKNIGYSLNACLRVHGFKDPDVYIYPPGVFSGSSQYPIRFTVQKCLQALLDNEDKLEKINTLYLLVPDTNYYKAFKEIENSRSSSSTFSWGRKSKDLKLHPGSSLEIFGPEGAPKAASQELEKKLKSEMERHTVTRELVKDSVDQFKKHLQTSPQDKIHITVTNKDITVAGLSKSVVEDFVKAHGEYLKTPQQAETSKKIPKVSRSNSRVATSFEWSRITFPAKEKSPFKKEENEEIEREFQQETNQISKWNIDFRSLTCLKPSTHGSRPECMYLLRNEKIEDHTLRRGTMTDLDVHDRTAFARHQSLKEPIAKISRIDSESQKERFEFKKKHSKSLKRQESLWHQVDENWASSIATYGFQRLFSYSPQNNTAYFSRRPIYDQSHGGLKCLLLCDVLCDDSFVKQVSPHPSDISINLEYTKMSDAHILPRFLCQIYY